MNKEPDNEGRITTGVIPAGDITTTTDRDSIFTEYSQKRFYSGEPALTVENIMAIKELLEEFNRYSFSSFSEEYMEKATAFERIQDIVFVREDFDL